MLFSLIRSTMLCGAVLVALAADDEIKPSPASGDSQATPMAFAEAQKVDAELLTIVKAELAKRLVEDQAVRSDNKKAMQMKEVDKQNTAYIKDLVGKLGWIDAGRFGAEASHAAFLIVQHSGDLPLMLAALPKIERDVKAKKLDADAFALLYDRTQLMLGKKQRYGSQIEGKSATPNKMPDTLVVSPLENRGKVDEYRAEIGLPPLVNYLDVIKKAYGIKKPIEFSPE